MNISELSFEQAMQELEKIVAKLESGQAELESAIADYERASALKKHCESKLNEAQMKIEKIVKDSGGNISSERIDLA